MNKEHFSVPNKPFSYKLFIDGEWVHAKKGKTFSRESPAHNTTVGIYEMADAEDTELAIEAAHKALEEGPWSKMSGAERSKILIKVADLIRENAKELALIETLESGKPITQANDEMEWAAGNWDYAATLGRHTKGESYNSLGEDMLAMTVREPIGVVSMITPWNFPLLIVSQKLPLALAVGCTAVIKPSEFTPGTTLKLGELLTKAGVPSGVVNIISGYGDPVGVTMTNHPKVSMVSFTGSTKVGKLIAASAGEKLKKVGLELGGKNPQIIFPDVNLEEVVDAVVFGVYFNMGECCNSGSRILVHDDIADELIQKVKEKSQQVQTGDPLDPEVKVGPIIHSEQKDKICSYMDLATSEGAELVLGGNSDENEAYVYPTIYDKVTPNMTIAKEEVFGPVLSIIRFSTLEEAIAIANDTLYGLSASIWTKDIDRAMVFSRKVKAGTVWVNTFMSGYAELPFGGYKESGLGREMGAYAIDEFTELKTIQVHIGEKTNWWLNK
ncbi:aldehyde dehydrogenase family protein [Galbibacter mesophilus]|uniref:aldehyde dehydrogenase family protein n=1 Tax=Galbibacter mesophilus TaxID=379069 RepID=UPI00191E68E2|nr:aldehyde dehydrogenase family protein [Galbibacter mesophilus]MCM5664348.1 aldehyde dehydrogenase family protein [Galbibacter mesophilus]